MLKKFLTILKEKTAIPLFFLCVLAISNFVMTSATTRSNNALPAPIVRASAPLTAQALLGDVGAALGEQFLKNNFMTPTTGKNWEKLHGENGVDFADACGKLVYAAADGVVVEVSANNSWNGGYGNFVVVQHVQGIRTKYAHLKNVLIAVNTRVIQGDPIGRIGNTGLTTGRTGCHLHLEFFGTKNPFAQ